jgi:polyisoprenoid-binding protein YceI
MKKWLIFCVASLFFFSFPLFAADTYQLDSNHTFVVWQVSHFGFSNPSGKWYASGTIVLDKNNPKNSKVTVNINMNDLVTGIPRWDEHLKGPEFFNVEKFPTATFVSDQVTLIGKESAKIKGLLTFHGVTKPVVLDVKLNKINVSPVTNKETAGFSASTVIKRSQFGMTSYTPGISDDVKLTIEAEGTKEPNK